MSFSETAVLAAFAGGTIFLGLPVARAGSLSPRVRAALASASAGVILFLIVEILGHAVEPVEASLEAAREGGPIGEFGARAGALVAGLGLGLLSVTYLSRRLVGLAEGGVSPRHMAAGTAAGLGLHNFSEGLAIGQSAAVGTTSLALILVIGFALHNGTEGFAISAPLGLGDRPSWRFLGALGLVGGGPTFVGGMVGYSLVSTILSIAFLSLAAGALIFVLGEIMAASRRYSVPVLAGAALALGFFTALGADFVLELAGA
jgi:ZIP family zinc transporter